MKSFFVAFALVSFFAGTVSAGTPQGKKAACTSVPYQVKQTATKTEYVEQQFDCSETKVVPECVMVEKTCYETAYREEAYSCPAEAFQTVCKPTKKSTAYRQLAKRNHGTTYASYTSKKPQAPVSPPPQQCTKVPVKVEQTCYKKVAYEVATPCSEKKCFDKQVTVPKTCSKKVAVQKPYTFYRTKYRDECRPAVPSKVPVISSKKGFYGSW